MEHIVTVIGYRERFLTKDQMDKLVKQSCKQILIYINSLPEHDVRIMIRPVSLPEIYYDTVMARNLVIAAMTKFPWLAVTNYGANENTLKWETILEWASYNLARQECEAHTADDSNFSEVPRYIKAEKEKLEQSARIEETLEGREIE